MYVLVRFPTGTVGHINQPRFSASPASAAIPGVPYRYHLNHYLNTPQLHKQTDIISTLISALIDIKYSNRTPQFTSHDMGHQKKSKGLLSAFPPAPDIASRRSDSGSRLEQSSVEQRPQQVALSPHATGHSRRFGLGNRSQSSSPLPSRPPSPSPGVEPEVTSDHHLVTSISSSSHRSPSCPDVQRCAPITQVSPLPSEPTASENPEPPPTCTPNIPIPTDQIQSPAETDTHAAPPHSSVVWDQALEIAKGKLSEKNLPSDDLTSLTSQCAEENIQTIFKSLNTLQEDKHKRRWSFTRHGKEIVIVKHLGDILRSVEKYSKILDTAIPSNSKVGALVWASIKGIMLVALNHVEAIEGFEVAIAALLEKMSICEFYSRIYSGVTLPSQSTVNSSQLQSMLDSTLPDLYAAVIVFSVKARTYFEAKGMKKMTNVLKSFDIEFQPFIDEINTKEGAIRQCADAATMERVRSKYNFT